ncbi:ABC transporter ATP-binding protein [Leptospira fluminis]|uniref:ABC transporter ATP-binding protein n=1 Tax=Leptospira fluminis TaxID=2484979 RepID=A0A4R9GS58_9LEPT|nr:ABC transporter ATP-binding protein [Leptospira fluminis]
MNSLLEIRDLTVGFGKETFFGRSKKRLLAVENLSLDLVKGETLGLVGESGCGKSTLGRAILRLLKPDSGRISYEKTDILPLSEKGFHPFRRKIQIVFQDPYSSLNPRMNIKEILIEGLLLHKQETKNGAIEEVKSILEKVGLPSDILERYPHEFSGGQRQRIAIARALVLKPEFVVLDEAVSALDVSTQAQVLLLLQDLKKHFGLSYLFISHDLGIVRAISDRIAVMYLGRIVEIGDTRNVFERPGHPYTQALFGSVFSIENRKEKKASLKGEVPSILRKPSGCHFHPRCPIAQEICSRTEPDWKSVGSDRKVLCHFPLEK